MNCELLHRSCYSSVYLGTSPSGSLTCFKVYCKGAPLQQRHWLNISRECSILSRLRELRVAGVVQLLSVADTPQAFSLQFKPCLGGNLYQRIERREFCDEARLCQQVIIPLLRVLAELHAEGIVHRDIKPENIFFEADGGLVLGDFGLAVDVNSDTACSRVGTMDYMSPEVLAQPSADTMALRNIPRSALKPYGSPCDVWALGILVHEALTGCTPFAHSEPSVAALKAQFGAPTQLPASASLGCQTFVAAVLQKLPGKRPSAAELLQHEWVQQHMAAAPPAAQGCCAPIKEPARPACSDLTILLGSSLMTGAFSSSAKPCPSSSATGPCIQPSGRLQAACKLVPAAVLRGPAPVAVPVVPGSRDRPALHPHGSAPSASHLPHKLPWPQPPGTARCQGTSACSSARSAPHKSAGSGKAPAGASCGFSCILPGPGASVALTAAPLTTVSSAEQRATFCVLSACPDGGTAQQLVLLPALSAPMLLSAANSSACGKAAAAADMRGAAASATRADSCKIPAGCDAAGRPVDGEQQQPPAAKQALFSPVRSAAVMQRLWSLTSRDRRHSDELLLSGAGVAGLGSSSKPGHKDARRVLTALHDCQAAAAAGPAGAGGVAKHPGTGGCSPVRLQAAAGHAALLQSPSKACRAVKEMCHKVHEALRPCNKTAAV